MQRVSPITTHVLDVSAGKPAPDIFITLEFHEGGDRFAVVGSGKTDSDGRLKTLLQEALKKGIYRLTFATQNYFASRSLRTLYPKITIEFEVQSLDEHYHIPLLLSPYGYSTYRGS